MAENVVANPGVGGDTFAADDIAGIKFPRTKLTIGADGANDGDVSAANPLPVTGTVTATTGGLTDAELRATAVPVSGTVTIQDGGGAITVDGTVELGAAALSALETITIASVTAPLPAGSNNIGTVELSATALAALESITVVDGGATISIDDGGGVITVDGTVELGATTLAALESITVVQATAANLNMTEASAASIKTAVEIMDDWDETDRAKVNIIAGQVAITAGAGAVAANTPRVTHASDDPVTTSLQLIDDSVVADDAGFTAATTKVIMSGFVADEASTDSVNEDDAGAARMTLDRKQIVTVQPHTAGGLTMSKTVSAASTNATSVKASAGQVYAIQATNVNAAIRYLKLYNKASAPTVGTDVPVKTIGIPGNTAGAGIVISWPIGIAFGTGIAFALTTESTDAGSTGVAANEIVVNIDYA